MIATLKRRVDGLLLMLLLLMLLLLLLLLFVPRSCIHVSARQNGNESNATLRRRSVWMYAQ